MFNVAMAIRNKIYLALITVASSFIFAGCSPSRKPTLDCPLMSSEIEVHAIGKSASFTTFDIPLVNNGNMPIEIKNVIGSCSCISAKYPHTIFPHQDAKITVSVSLDGWSEGARPISLIVTTNSPDIEAKQIDVTLIVRYAIAASIQKLNFGSLYHGESATRYISFSLEMPDFNEGDRFLIHAEPSQELKFVKKYFGIRKDHGKYYQQIAGTVILTNLSEDSKSHTGSLHISSKSEPNVTEVIPCEWKSIDNRKRTQVSASQSWDKGPSNDGN